MRKTLPIQPKDPSKLNEQILKAIFQKIGRASKKSLSLREARVGLEHIDADTFFDGVADLTSENLLLDQGQGYVALTPEGWEKASLLVNQTSAARQNAPANMKLKRASPSPAANNDAHPLTESLAWLVELMAPNLSELQLPEKDHQQALQDLANLKRLITDKPNPVLLKAVCASLKNITADAIGKRLAAGGQPVIWGAVLALFNQI
jgi:hypothetical protein